MKKAGNKNWGFHSHEDPSLGLLGCDVV